MESLVAVRVRGLLSYDVTTDRLVVCSSSGVWMTIPGANCMAGSVVGVRYVVSYPHETVAHGGTTSLFATASIAGGTASYTAQGLCDDGVMKVSGEVETVSCSSGYTLQGGSCMALCSSGVTDGYSHGDILHGETEGVSKTASISGGSARYTATASCSAGAVSISGESVSSVSCNSGYSRNGNSCMAMCSSGKVSGYSHSRLYHGGSQSVSKWVNISGGRKYYKATARCSNGSVSITSSYVSSVSCNSGYQRSGNSCKALKRSCLDLLQSGYRSSGVYTIDPDGSGGGSSFKVYCDQKTDGGGWALAVWQATSPHYGLTSSTRRVYDNTTKYRGKHGFNARTKDMPFKEVLVRSFGADGKNYDRAYTVSGTLEGGVRSTRVRSLTHGISWSGTKLQIMLTSNQGKTGNFTQSRCGRKGTSYGHTTETGTKYYLTAVDYVGCSYRAGTYFAFAQHDRNNGIYTAGVHFYKNGRVSKSAKKTYFLIR